MKHVWLLSFFCALAFNNTRGAEQNLVLGCEQFAVWSNAQQVPVWRFFHCPSEVRARAIYDAMVVHR